MTSRTALLAAAAIAMTATSAKAEAWPDLPVPVKNGFVAELDGTVYAGLGTAGQEIYALDLSSTAKGWTRLAAFSGPAPNQPAVAVSNGKIYVFAGSGKADPAAAAPVIFDTVHAFDPAENRWERLDTATPAGLLGAAAVTRADGKIVLLGGYNKAQFDTYLASIVHVNKETQPDLWAKTVSDFMGRKPEDYAWNRKALLFDPSTGAWSDLGSSPFLPNCGAGVVGLNDDSAILVNGEIKPGLRTDMVQQVTFGGASASWKQLPSLPSGTTGKRQEGVAGAYAARIGDVILVAGGANFPGARDKADTGHWYAHEGLTKAWSSDVFTFTNGVWSLAGSLPRGMGYGGSIATGSGMLIVGGEDSSGSALQSVFLLRVEDGEVIIED